MSTPQLALHVLLLTCSGSLPLLGGVTAFQITPPPSPPRASIRTAHQPRTRPSISAVYHQQGRFQSFATVRFASTASPHGTAETDTSASRAGTWEEDHDDDDDDQDLISHASDTSSDDEGSDEGVDDENTSPLLEEYKQWMASLQKAQKGLEKKQNSLENEWNKAQNLEDTVARAQLIVNNLYLFNNNGNDNNNDGVYYVVDWENDGVEVELKLDSQYESASAEADALFAQARKLKRGSQVVQELLEQVQQAMQVLVDCRADLESAVDKNSDDNTLDEGRLRLVQDRLRRTSSTTQFQEPKESSQKQRNHNNSRNNQNNFKKKPALGTPASNVRKLLTPAGATVLVGRNRRGNEFLTFTQARGNDIWMHARGTPGAHVLVLDRRGSVHPTDACLEFAAHLAAFYSDGRAESKVPVTLADPKHLLKPRGAPLGAVKLRQEGQVLYGCPDLVPQELVDARAQSGQSEEYRSADKAKHRKQTNKHQRQQQKRRRQQQRQKRGGGGAGKQEGEDDSPY